MIQGSRNADSDFKQWHGLYRACAFEDVIDGRVAGPTISCRQISVNWSKYSVPWDVIFDRKNWGVAHLFVQDLPTDLPIDPPPGANLFDFRVGHVPENDNYAHSQIEAYKRGQAANAPVVMVTTDLPSTVKKQLRQILADKFTVIILPVA